MSDDDCDIFNLPVKKLSAIPQPQFPKCMDLNDSDYDFINTSAVKNIIKTKRDKEPNKKDSKKTDSGNAQESQSMPAPLSPVSKAIQEMEKEVILAKNKASDDLPIARRTRSSIGKRSASPVKVHSPPSATPAVSTEPKTRGRKKATALTRTKQTNSRQTDNHVITDITQYQQRGTRREVAELAARSRVIDSIDLVSAVAPRVEGIVNLNSDDEANEHNSINNSAGDTIEMDKDNSIVNVNLSWLGEIQMYPLRKHQKFAQLFNEMSKRNNVPIDELVVHKEDKIVLPTDTWESLGLRVFDILSGYAVKLNNNAKLIEDRNSLPKTRKFQLKVQAAAWKKPRMISMKKSETFKILYIKCSEELECNMQDFNLYFDGEVLQYSDTPKGLEMDSDDTVDLKMK